MTNKDHLDVKLVLYTTALQAVIAREGLIAAKSKEQLAKEAMEYAERAIKEWELNNYENSVL
jgi:hypothetical protein